VPSSRTPFSIGRTTITPARGGDLLSLLSKMFNLAVTWEMCPNNPCKGVRKFPEEGRQRYLTQEELAKLLQVLAERPNQRSADAIRLMLMTGCRRSEALGATRDQFDLPRSSWVKPSSHTKQRRRHHVELSPIAVELLTNMQAQRDPSSPYLFPGPDGKPQEAVKKFWHNVCEAAGFEDLHVHDIRQNAEFGVSSGESLPLIGAMLGHTNPATTQRYAHLKLDPKRRAAKTIEDIITAAAAAP
jgi:integrase